MHGLKIQKPDFDLRDFYRRYGMAGARGLFYGRSFHQGSISRRIAKLPNVASIPFALAAVFVWHSALAFADTTPTAGQLTSSSYGLPEKPLTSILPPPIEQNNNAPKGAADNKLLVGNLTVEALDRRYAGAAEKLIAPLRGQRRSVSAIYDVAAQIQKLYSDDGAFLTRVVIPPQDVKNGGTVNLKVVAGFISDIDTEGLSPEIRERVRRYFAPLQNRTDVSLSQFQRALLLAAGTNGVKLKTNLKPSKQEMGVTLTVTGNYDPVSGQLVTDNALPSSLGMFETSLSAAINSPFHHGEQLYLNVVGSPAEGGIDQQSPRRVFAAGLTAPITDNGLTGNVEYTWSNTVPIVSGNALATSSRYQRISGKLTYPLILDQTTVFNARLGFDDVDEINQATTFKYTLYHDHLELLRAGLDYNKLFTGGMQLSSSLDITQGLSGLWSRNAADATTGDAISQSGASDRFTKMQARLHLYQEFQNGLAWDVNARTQYVPTGTVMNAEKFVIGGASDLSGGDSGGWSGDHGWSIRGELQYDASSYLKNENLGVRPYLFAARGQVYVQNPSAGELAVDGATGFGVGLRGQWVPANAKTNPVDFALEAARNISDHPAQKASDWRFNLSAGVKF